MAKRIAMRLPNYMEGEHEAWDAALCNWTKAYKHAHLREPTLEERQRFVNDYVRMHPKTWMAPVKCVDCADWIATLLKSPEAKHVFMNTVRESMRNLGLYKPRGDVQTRRQLTGMTHIGG